MPPKVTFGTRGIRASTLIANVLAGVPTPVAGAVMSATPRNSNDKLPKPQLVLDVPPPPLEQVDPVLAEHLRLIVDGKHPAVKTVVHEGENIHLKKHDGTWLHRRIKPRKLPGRNEPCFCGSGKKFKKCCLA